MLSVKAQCEWDCVSVRVARAAASKKFASLIVEDEARNREERRTEDMQMWRKGRPRVRDGDSHDHIIIISVWRRDGSLTHLKSNLLLLFITMSNDFQCEVKIYKTFFFFKIQKNYAKSLNFTLTNVSIFFGIWIMNISPCGLFFYAKKSNNSKFW